MTNTKTKKAMSMADEDAAFFRNAYKNDPKARAAMDKEGIVPPGVKKTAEKKQAAAKKGGKK